MKPVFGLSRRSLLAVMGLAMAAPPVTLAAPHQETAEDRLCACLGRLWQIEHRWDYLSNDDTAAAEALLDRIDTILIDTAGIAPDTERGFGIKARIAQEYGDWETGQEVQKRLLVELIERGGVRL